MFTPTQSECIFGLKMSRSIYYAALQAMLVEHLTSNQRPDTPSAVRAAFLQWKVHLPVSTAVRPVEPGRCAGHGMASLCHCTGSKKCSLHCIFSLNFLFTQGELGCITFVVLIWRLPLPVKWNGMKIQRTQL